MSPQDGKRSDATRSALLRAAREEFADLGLAGARVDRIAEAAGVNKERIYGIFGSKDKLFDAVLIDAMQEFTDQVDPLWRSGDVGGFVGRLFDYQREHPQLLRLISWEALHRGDDAHDIDGWHGEHYREKLKGAMKQFGTDDPFKAGLMTLAICAIPNWFNLVSQLRRLLLGDRANDEEAIRAFLIPFAEGAAKAAGALGTGTAPVTDLTGAPGKATVHAIEPGRSETAPDTTPSAVALRKEAESDPAADEAHSGTNLIADEADANPVAAAAERLRRTQAEAEAAKAALGQALRNANAEGASANRLAKRVAGTVSRPVVLKLLAE